MKKRVRAAILGTGFIGRVHLEALCRLGFVEVAALVTADHGQADRLAREYGVERVETDYRRVLDDPDIDVIHVCTPTALHAQMVKDALLAGKHVLSEKPLATSVADAVGTGGARQEARRAQLHQPQPALLPAGAAHAQDARAGRTGRDPRGAGAVHPGLSALRHRLELAARFQGLGPVVRHGRHRLALLRHDRARHRPAHQRALRRPEHLPRRCASARPAGWRASPASCGKGSRSTRSTRSTPRTTARCCCASATVPAGASAPARCSPARRTA